MHLQKLGVNPLWLARTLSGLILFTTTTTTLWSQDLPPPETPSPTVPPSPEIQLMPRQMMVIREGLDAIYGQVMFVVRNNATVPLPLKFRVLLPKETSDFSPREGLEAGEVILANPPSSQAGAQSSQNTQGFQGLLVDKTFPAGVHMMTIGFKVDAHFGATTLTLSHPDGIKDLNLLSLKEGPVTLESPGMIKNTRPEEADPLYDALELKSPVEPQQTLSIQVTGLPEGRTRLWWMGGIFGGILLALATLLALRTRPKLVPGSASPPGKTL